MCMVTYDNCTYTGMAKALSKVEGTRGSVCRDHSVQLGKNEMCWQGSEI